MAAALLVVLASLGATDRRALANEQDGKPPLPNDAAGSPNVAPPAPHDNAPHPEYAYRGEPQWTPRIPEVEPDCEAKLTRAGVTFRAAQLDVHTANGLTCGAPQVVTYLNGPGHITYSTPPLLTCRMALALAAFEGVIQEEAQRTMHARVTRIEQIGTYDCSNVANNKLVSEHAYANAIDLAGFTFDNGRSVVVLTDFEKTGFAPSHPQGAFLHAISARAIDENVFSTVLTPFSGALHKNHLHLDLAPYRIDGAHGHGI